MMKLYKAFNMAISMFTIIPLPKYEWDEDAAKHIMKFYPIVGLIIGTLWYLIFLTLTKLNVSIILSSSIIMAFPYIITGFLHLDGFMDVSDALLSRRPKEEKLKILKDSRVGAFSVISLVLLLIIDFAAINTFFAKGNYIELLILIPALSRTLIAYFMITKDMISESYLGNLFKKGTGIYDKILLIIIFSIFLLGAYLLANIHGLIVIMAMLLAAITLINKTEKALGGINGDVAGYILVISEFIAVLTLAIL